jgi:hypothetical protein
MKRADKHLAEVETLVEPGERLVAWLPADDIASATSMAPTVSGVLALTTRRLIFRGSSRRGAVGRELALDELRGFEAVWHRSAVDLRFAGNPEFPGFLARRVDLAEPFVGEVEAAIGGSSPSEPPEPTVADLAALGDLYERGLLTAEEFTIAKKRLLG